MLVLLNLHLRRSGPALLIKILYWKSCCIIKFIAYVSSGFFLLADITLDVQVYYGNSPQFWWLKLIIKLITKDKRGMALHFCVQMVLGKQNNLYTEISLLDVDLGV